MPHPKIFLIMRVKLQQHNTYKYNSPSRDGITHNKTSQCKIYTTCHSNETFLFLMRWLWSWQITGDSKTQAQIVSKQKSNAKVWYGYIWSQKAKSCGN